MSQYDIAPPDMSGLEKFFSDPETRKKAMELYQNSTPEEKELTDTVASAVAQKPDAVPQIAETVAPNGMKTVGATTPISPAKDTRREDFMARYEKQKAADKGEYDKGVAQADKGRDSARNLDLANTIISGFGRAGAAASGNNDSVDYYRAAQNKALAGPEVGAIDAKKAELVKWLKEKQKLGNDDFTTGLKAIDSEDKNNLDNRKLDELTAHNKVNDDLKTDKVKSEIASINDKLSVANRKLLNDSERLGLQKRKYDLEEFLGTGHLNLSTRQQDYKESEAGMKENQRVAGLQIPGYHLTDGANPDKKEAQEGREAVATYKSAKHAADQLELLASKGVAAWNPTDLAKASSLISDMRLEANKLHQLKRITEIEFKQFVSELPDPVSPSFKNLVSNANVTGMRKTMELAKIRNDEAMRSRGYEPDDSSTQERQSPQPKSVPMRSAPKPSGAEGTVHLSDGTNSYDVPKSKVDAFLSKHKELRVVQ